MIHVARGRLDAYFEAPRDAEGLDTHITQGYNVQIDNWALCFFLGVNDVNGCKWLALARKL